MKFFARSRGAAVTLSLMAAFGVFGLVLALLAPVDEIAVRLFVLIGGVWFLGLAYFAYAVSSAVITESHVRRGWLGAKRVPLASIARLEVKDGNWVHVVAVMQDGSEEPLLRFAGTIFNTYDYAHKVVAEAHQSLEAAISNSDESE